MTVTTKPINPTGPPAAATTAAHTLRLVLGDQLNPLHPWFATPQPDVVVVLMELRQETDCVRHHAQKVLAIFAAMRDFARHLKAQGHRVRYVALDDPSNRQHLTANLDALIAHYRARAVQWQDPDEWRLDEQLRTWAAQQPLPCEAVDSAHFFTTRDEAGQQFAGRKQWLMEHFYRRLRRQHGVLMTVDTDNDKDKDKGKGREPEGGQWNFDHDNRQPWRGQPPEPADPRPHHDHTALWAMLQAAGVQTMGEPSAADVRWPINRAESLALLDAFVAHALPHFGDFQDAFAVHRPRLFHSLLSFSLNTKMLSPHEVVQRAEAAWRAGQAPLHAVEGFIRQILGWREYVRGVYWAQMPGYTERNALGHTRHLPHWFWSGDTRMACMASALTHSLDNAHAHHIERLMVIGNFALLAGLDPQAVHRWYLGVYVDAFEWVEAPNTLGMSQFADGGLLATKPYVSSAAYLNKMGDACTGCAYNAKARTDTDTGTDKGKGREACPFNALYWDFFLRHQSQLGRNARLALVYRQLDKMAPADKQALQAQAQANLARIDEL
jgi:deoxyribodipyrimidine photolyase-related protein